jgi:hypothetical protein
MNCQLLDAYAVPEPAEGGSTLEQMALAFLQAAGMPAPAQAPPTNGKGK